MGVVGKYFDVTFVCIELKTMELNILLNIFYHKKLGIWII